MAARTGADHPSRLAEDGSHLRMTTLCGLSGRTVECRIVDYHV